jgi:hypothetical protein
MAAMIRNRMGERVTMIGNHQIVRANMVVAVDNKES